MPTPCLHSRAGLFATSTYNEVRGCVLCWEGAAIGFHLAESALAEQHSWWHRSACHVAAALAFCPPPQGATVFLDAPKSDLDSAKLIPAEQLMLGPPQQQP